MPGFFPAPAQREQIVNLYHFAAIRVRTFP
jgi:hypothetical protein